VVRPCSTIYPHGELWQEIGDAYYCESFARPEDWQVEESHLTTLKAGRTTEFKHAGTATPRKW